MSRASLRSLLLLLPPIAVSLAMPPLQALAAQPAQEARSAAATAAGRWKGAIQVPGMELGVEVRLWREGEEWKGEIDIPQQGARGLGLEKIEVVGEEARFSIAGVPGAPRFEGRLQDGGQRLEGQFTQLAQRFPFALERDDREAAAAQARETLAGLADFLGAELERWKTPGVAIAVVWKGELLLAEGFGLRDLEAKAPVTADTLFAIGSTTKAFTCALLATLVEEGKLDWNEPARRIVPELELADDYATLHITPLDLVTHRSGLPRHDFAWYGSEGTRAELLARLRHLEASAPMRTEFQYQNLMYMVAGEVAGRRAGTSWEEATQSRLLEPLGMRRSNLSVIDMQRDPDHALPYQEKDGILERIPFRNIDTVGAAGSINSSAREMAAWMRCLLADGKLEGGDPLLEPASVERLFQPVLPLPAGVDPFGDEGPASYALGWMVQSYRGRPRVHHGGGIDGFTALVTLFREDELGIVALSNCGGSPLVRVATLWVADRLLWLEPIDWSARMQLVAEAGKAAEKTKAEGLPRKAGTSPSHPLADYAGEYRHGGYGSAEVVLVEGALALERHGERTSMEHWHYDVFRLTEGAAEGTRIQFHMDLEGEISAFTVPLEPRVAPLRMERVPPAKLSDPARLARYEGLYDLAGLSLRLSLRGARLTLSIPGQPTYVLVPRAEDHFTVDGLEGYSLRAEWEEGRCVRLRVVQPDGAFLATRRDG